MADKRTTHPYIRNNGKDRDEGDYRPPRTLGETPSYYKKLNPKASDEEFEKRLFGDK